jgi:hypothetical protein
MPGKIAAFVSTLAVFTLLSSACSKSADLSPTATAKAYYDAQKAKDVQGMKNTLSKNSLALMEEMGKMGNKTLDESLKESDQSQPATFEARGEKITGDAATIEVKDKEGKWQTMPFVKEDGRWKMAVDQAFEKAMQQLDKEIQAPNPAAVPAASPEKSAGEQPAQEDEKATP